MPLRQPDCGECPWPYRVQMGNPSLGREVRYSICCAIKAIEKLTGETFHEIMWDIEPGDTTPDSSELESGRGGPKPLGKWDFDKRLVAEKRAMGFEMKGFE